MQKDGNSPLIQLIMNLINSNLELKFNSREIFSIMLSLQMILKVRTANPDLLRLTKKFHAQITSSSDEQLIRMDLFDTGTLLGELLLFNAKYLQNNYLDNICLNIKDVLLAYLTVEILDEIDLQNLLKESGIQ